MITLSEKDARKAKTLTDNTWMVPGKGIFHVYSGGRAVRLQVKSFSFSDFSRNEGWMSYQSADGVVQVGLSVRFDISGRTLRLGPVSWGCWTEADRKIITASIEKAGFRLVVRRDPFPFAIGAAIIAVVLTAASFGWSNHIIWQSAVEAASVTPVADDTFVVQSPIGNLTVQTVAGELKVQPTGELAEGRFCNSGGLHDDVGKFILAIATAGKAFPEVKGKGLEMVSVRHSSRVGGKVNIESITLSIKP
ncbi:MAG: hypothetical protein WCT25_00380 [Candidatus Paceibacterota bacterium]|jgi:hypothetical protein